ncbi:hypothetical protein Taro_046080 [Colocasia esculenta]|uniref:Uncharacterized protein n=1 Tax=Colocasia esculenta TaxID=4460 RepID=A0A843X3N2_COLES|nr:hypothetical protein [Colocasia esculenta]
MVAFGDFRSGAQISLRERGHRLPMRSHTDTASSDSLDYANRWHSPHAEPPSHIFRKSCSTRREISSPGRGYGCPNIADIVTPPVYSHPFSERIGHNFPHGHRNRLCEHNSESALRDDRQGAGIAEFRSGAKIPPAACVLVH